MFISVQSAPCLTRASLSPIDPSDLFCLGQMRGLGWNARKSRLGAASRVQQSCSIACLLVARRSHAREGLARNAAREQHAAG